LTSWGCQFHAQAVLCPGLNDGRILEKTITDLGELWPNLQSLAIVPVGITKHRANLPFLRKFAPEEAAAVLRTVHQAQSGFFSRHGSRLVFAADEFYLQAQEVFPPLTVYEDLFQLENGVGLWPLFKTQFAEGLGVFGPNYTGQPRSFTIITGVDAACLWEELRRGLRKVAPALDLRILPVTNRFFGAEVTVTGLLTGRDILAALREKPPAAETCLLLPRVCLRPEEAVFLDGLTLDHFCAATHLPVRVLNINGAEVVRTLLGLEEA
jgi:NifB/MoaA-like Fe-S oxidoreductase